MLYAVTFMGRDENRQEVKLWYSETFDAWVKGNRTLPMGTKLYSLKEEAQVKALELGGQVTEVV